MTTNDQTELRTLLRAGTDWDPWYPTASTDHLPMALQALWRLGASGAQMREFQRDYVTKLVPLAQREPVAVDGDAWQQWLGDWRIYRPLRARLLTDIAAHGRAAVLRQWLPRLIVCAAIDALHPLIRVGYGIEQEIDDEIAAGLAYWAAVHVPGVPLGQRAAQGQSAGGAADLFARLRGTAELVGLRFPSHGFGDRLNRIHAAPAFAQVADWRDPGIDLQALAREAARIYLVTDNFFALHMVTGTHALRTLAPYIDDTQVLLDRGWQALAATYLIIGAPAYEFAVRDAVVPSDANLLAAALRARDDTEHVIKLAHSARSEFGQWQAAEHASILEGIVRRHPG